MISKLVKDDLIRQGAAEGYEEAVGEVLEILKDFESDLDEDAYKDLVRQIKNLAY